MTKDLLTSEQIVCILHEFVHVLHGLRIVTTSRLTLDKLHQNNDERHLTVGVSMLSPVLELPEPAPSLRREGHTALYRPVSHKSVGVPVMHITPHYWGAIPGRPGFPLNTDQ